MSRKSKTEELFSSIRCHAWNADRTQVAICPNSNVIKIYKTNGSRDLSKWTLEHVLEEHDHLIAAIDWAPKTNRILSCSQDRNAYVWNYVENKWKPSLVVFKTYRAATCCQWSPDENKFAVGTGNNIINVCYYDKETNWWISKAVKNAHDSTVKCLAWHPTDNTLLVSGGSDFMCKVFSVWIKGLDPKETKKASFGKVIHEYPTKGWVHDIRFSPLGTHFSFVAHDSTLYVANMETKALQTLTLTNLPFVTLWFLSENAIVAAGYDFNPALFTFTDGVWKFCGFVETSTTSTASETKTGSIRSAFEKFQAKAMFGDHKKN
jgi:actin related protein 2/3 complex subunit 1A/1B